METVRMIKLRAAHQAAVLLTALGLSLPCAAQNVEPIEPPKIFPHADAERMPQTEHEFAPPLRRAPDTARRDKTPNDEPDAKLDGSSLILQAYDMAKTAASESDYSAILETCRRGSGSQLSPDTRAYADRLMAWAHNRRGEARAAARRDKEAIEDFEVAVRLDSTRWRAFHNRGVSLALLGRYQEAADDFTRTIKLNPTFANAYFNRGEMLYEQGKFAEALDDYSQAIRLAPEDAAAHNSRGHAYYRAGSFREAIHDFSQAIRLDPANAAALTNRGDVFADLGYYAEALRDYHRAIELDPQLGRALQSIAWLVATCPDAQYRDSELALSAAQRAIQIDGHDNHQYLATLAAAHADAGDYSAARKSLQQAIELAPREEAPHYQARLALYEQGKPFRVQPRGKDEVRRMNDEGRSEKGEVRRMKDDVRRAKGKG